LIVKYSTNMATGTGKSLIEMPRMSAKMLRAKDVASGPGRKVERSAKATNPSSGCTEPQESGEGVLELRWIQGFKVPMLNNRKIRVSGKIPRLSSLKLKSDAAVGEEASREAVVTKPPPEPAQPPEPTSPAPTTVVPAPSKRQTLPQKAKAAASERAIPKPLKVIRRRREEAPKVFETPPKIVPKAMLEGIDLDRDTDAEN
jgi:hypothetical protein